MERCHWCLAWALLSLRLVQGQPMIENFGSLTYTCLVPAEENQAFNETESGKQMANFMFSLDDDPEASVAKSTGHLECGNFPYSKVIAKCEDAKPGQMCAYAINYTRTCFAINRSTSKRSARTMACPAGFECPLGKHYQPRVCRKGYHCPEGTINKGDCPIGYYCPISAKSVFCNSSVRNYSGVECMPGKDGRTLLPKACGSGSFCTNGEPEECPAKHFCPNGTDVPLKCGASEICGKGTVLPSRFLRSFAEFVLNLLVYVSAVYTLECWCLQAKMWWVRIVLFTLGIAILLAYQFYKAYWEHSKTIYMPIAFLAGLLCVNLYGIFFTKIVDRACGNFRTWIELPVVCVVCIVGGFFLKDFYSGCFIAVLFPSVMLAREVFAGSDGDPSNKLGGLLVGCVVCLTIIGMTSWRRATVYAIGILTLLLFHITSHFYIQWRWKRNQATPPTTPTTRASLAVPLTSSRSISDPEEARIVDSFDVDSSNSRKSADHGGHGKCGIGLKLQDVSLTVGPQTILDRITLSIPAGSSVAVMGPSGCGKSSITNVLSGRAGYGTVKGTILINDSDTITIKQLASVTGFVAQDDVMHGNLTVEENVNFSAQLRLPTEGSLTRNARAEQLDMATTKVLEQFGLGDPVLRATRIGDENQRGVSGGQRKRVSIAMEFVAKPSLLFLDEPTSGLDSTTSHHVVEVFTKAARDSMCTTTAVIHQPRYETLMLFDQLILLAAGGYLVYSGPTRDVESYFSKKLLAKFPEKANPADTLLDVMTLNEAKKKMASDDMLQCEGYSSMNKDQFGKWLAKVWSTSDFARAGNENQGEPLYLPILNVEACTWGDAVTVHMKRAALQIKRDYKQILQNNLLLVFGLVVYCLSQDPTNPENAFMSPVLAFFLLMLTQGVGAQRVFGGRERLMVWREAGVCVSTTLCFIGRDIAALAEILLGVMFFAPIYYSLGPLLCSHHTMFWASFSFIYCVYGLSYIWSVLLSPDSAQMMCVVSSFMSFLLVGVQPAFAELASSSVGINLMALSPLRWVVGYLMADHTLTEKYPYTRGALSNSMIQYFSNQKLKDLAMPLVWIEDNQWHCECGAEWVREVKDRWSGDAATGRPMNSFVCSLKSLFFLGAFFRAMALLCMLITSKLKAQGGGHILRKFEVVKDHEDEQEVTTASSALKHAVGCFLLLITDVQITLLLKTH